MVEKKRTKVDTLIISDIHLGFKLCRARDLVRILDDYRFERLILNGDIFDDLNFNRLDSEHWEVLSLFRHLSKFCEVVWIIGNHDGRIEELSRLIGVKVHNDFMWLAGRKKCLAIHGHQYDRFMYKNRLLSQIAGRLFYFLHRFDGKNEQISNWIKKNSRSWLRMSEEVAAGAVKYAGERGASYVFCGHTHLARDEQFGAVHYYNSGAWVDHPSHLILIKGDAITLKLVR